MFTRVSYNLHVLIYAENEQSSLVGLKRIVYYCKLSLVLVEQVKP
jgi:hypothetical protein